MTKKTTGTTKKTTGTTGTTKKPIIAFQGEKGAFSHIACQNFAPQAQAVARPTFEDVFDMVADGKAHLAMIPIENSLAGRVAAIHHLLPKSQLSIIAEHFEHIHFSLLALPSAKIEDLKIVYSHIMALGQCRKIIRALNLTPIATGDTAGAALEIAQNQDIRQAALAPQRAAEIYHLKILRENVEDSQHNITRFIILRREPLEIVADEIDDKKWITSFIFRVRNVPSALYKALGGFASNGVNMLRLESGQIEPPFHVTQFYADIEGHPQSAAQAEALEELRFFSTHVQMLGTYLASPLRQSLEKGKS